ncbi:haloacid dehalogenase type II [Candidatus Entotheonella palauensis]|nr:haloacid dehalogenase type II [Candidatus Entotheonella palauensis]
MANQLSNIKACVFDAYGTLFDFNSAADRCRDVLGDKADELSAVWRTKQLQYTWLRGLMGRHKSFWEVTGDALDFAMDTVGVNDGALRERLMGLYYHIDAFPEVPEVLQTLKKAGVATAILSNGSPDMLEGAVKHTGIGDYLDAVLSVETVGVFKPHPSVYDIPTTHFNVSHGEISFQSSNAWDAVGAATFGMRVVWCNRYGQRPERLTAEPDAEITTLRELPELLGIGS